MNMDLENITPRRRNLKELRKGARLEKVPCGSKKNQSMRKFDIIPLHKQLNNDEVQQEIIHEARVACTFPGCESTFSQRSSMTRHLA